MKVKTEFDYWRSCQNDTDAGGKPYQGRDKLYQTPPGQTGGPWPLDIREHYRKLEEKKK